MIQMQIPTITFFRILRIAAKIKFGSMLAERRMALCRHSRQSPHCHSLRHKPGVFYHGGATVTRLWGIESDAGDKYFEQAFQDEREILIDMLASFKTFEITEHPVKARPG
jgi:hypothetical protein